MNSLLAPPPVRKLIQRCKCGRVMKPALGASRCEPCELAREARRSLDAIISAGDPILLSEAVGWLQAIELEPSAFRSAAGRAILHAGRAADAEMEAARRPSPRPAPLPEQSPVYPF